MTVNELRALSLKTIINELDLLKKKLLFNETFEKKRFVTVSNQINRKTT